MEKIENWGIFSDLQIRKAEKTLALLILVSVKAIIIGRSERVSDIGSFSESVPWIGEASNDHKFRVADAVKKS